MPYSQVNINLRFGGICRLHCQGRRLSQARKQREAGVERRLTFTELHGVMYLKTDLPIKTVVYIKSIAKR
jgi:hypothetical protein